MTRARLAELSEAQDAELVATPDLITVHITDHGKPMATKGAAGKIRMLTDTAETVAELIPSRGQSYGHQRLIQRQYGYESLSRDCARRQKTKHVAFRSQVTLHEKSRSYERLFVVLSRA